MKPKRKKPLTIRQVALKHGFRSGLEDKIAERLTALEVPFEYEKLIIGYTQPEKKRTYILTSYYLRMVLSLRARAGS